MKKLLLPVLLLILFFAAGCGQKNPGPVACTMEAKLCPDGSAVGRTGPNCEFAACPEASATSSLVYKNDQYGFSLDLAADWQGYSVTTSSIEYGEKVLLRHPQWTDKSPYEDIPVLIYSLAQWQKWEADDFQGYPTAAPIGPTERGRNNLYVFATAPRYNYDYQTGWEEAENIIKTLKAISL